MGANILALPGNPEPRKLAPGADLRTDLPLYAIYQDGQYVTGGGGGVREMGDQNNQFQDINVNATIDYQANENITVSFGTNYRLIVNDAFVKEMRKRQLIDLEIQYNIKEQQREIALLKQEMRLKELELEHQKTIEAQNAKLKMNNEELKQFTYAISHDLKEPLRMIGSFSKLWIRRHQKTADERDEEYFHYISGGVTRMSPPGDASGQGHSYCHPSLSATNCQCQQQQQQ